MRKILAVLIVWFNLEMIFILNIKSSFDVECGVEYLGLYITLLSILFIPANDLKYLDAFFPNCSNAPKSTKTGIHLYIIYMIYIYIYVCMYIYICIHISKLMIMLLMMMVICFCGMVDQLD